jgi:hypothetical protein
VGAAVGLVIVLSAVGLAGFAVGSDPVLPPQAVNVNAHTTAMIRLINNLFLRAVLFIIFSFTFV